MMLKNGQWVKFKASGGRYDGAHRSSDGMVVGIYQQATYDDVGRMTIHAHVAAVKTDGTDVGHYPSVADMTDLALADWLHDVPESRMFPVEQTVN